MQPAIALIDENPIVLIGIDAILRDAGRFEVVATGRSASDAVKIAMNDRPTLVILGPGVSGDARSAVSSLAAVAIPAIILTSSACADTALKMLDAGAKGYLLLSCSPEELIAAIDAVAQGETFINQTFANRLIANLHAAAMQKISPGSTRLNIREQQIIELLLRGCTNREIAEDLRISEKTVKHYMTVLMHKLQVRSRLEVVLAAQKMAQPPHLTN